MKASKTFAIIVPFKNLNKFVFECIGGCLKQTTQDFELILLPDNPVDKKLFEKFGKSALKKIRCIATGGDIAEGIISAKRNIGIESTKAEFLAFVDSDACPKAQWLESTLPLLKDKKVGIVGGPNLPPKGIGFWESVVIKAMDLNFTRKGLYTLFGKLKKYRGAQVYQELASSNMIVSRKLCLEVGKFDEKFFTGEDMLFCAMVRKKGRLILFNRKTAVYHHTRSNLLMFFRRIMQYSLGKYKVLKELQETPIFNFLLAGFALYIVLLPLVALVFPLAGLFYLATLALYLLLVCIDCLANSVKLLELPACILVVFLIHIAYGFGSLQAILSTPQNHTLK